MKKIILFISLLPLFLQVYSQLAPSADTTSQTNTAALTLIQQVESQHLTDSLKQAILLEQLNKLQQNEISQRQLLSRQLQELRHTDSIRNKNLQRRIDSLKQHTQGFPVTIGQDSICFLYTNIGSFSPQERAEHSSERILKTAGIFSSAYDTLLLVTNDNTTDIIYNDQILLAVTEMDALWAGTDRNALARDYQIKILSGITRYQENTSLITLLKRSGLCLLVILGQFLLIKGVNYFFRRTVDEKIRNKKDSWFTGIKIKDFEMLNSEKQIRVFLFLSKMTRYLVNLIQLYITIPILFSIFPLTQRLAETLFGWILTPVATIFRSFINYLPKLFMIIVIVLIMRYIVKFLRYLANEIAQEKLKVPGFYPDWAKATFNILRIFLYAFMLVMIFPLFPSSDTEIFKGVSVFIGIIFSLGSSSIIANLVAGMVITYMRPFKIGDRIKIGELTGDVVEKSPFVTRIKTPKNEIITVPNSNVMSSSVINYSFSAAENGLILYTSVTIGYDVPWKQVHELLLQAASRTQDILKEPQAFVLQTSLDDFYVSYQLCAYTREAAKQALTYSELHQNIQDCFNEAGVEIMSPHYRANRDGDTTTVPPVYLKPEKR